jgi:hypothetical protein
MLDRGLSETRSNLCPELHLSMQSIPKLVTTTAARLALCTTLATSAIDVAFATVA